LSAAGFAVILLNKSLPLAAWQAPPSKLEPETMNQNIQRAKDLLPSIIITVLSMIQALALELFWTKIQATEFLWQGGWLSTVFWLQLAVTGAGILLIWIMYVSLMLRFSWLPSMQDTMIPFAIGLLEFSLIDLMGPATLGPWFLLLAATFGLSLTAIHTSHRRARKEPENDYFFSQVAPARWRDYAWSVTCIVLLVLMGIALWLTNGQRTLAVVCLVFALGALLFQLLMSRRYWMHTLNAPGPGPGP
jgi:hypothetical protein